MQVLYNNVENNCQLCYIPDFITDQECKYVKQVLIIKGENDEYVIPSDGQPYLLHHPPINIYGKKYHQQRSVGFFTNNKHVKGYRYSKQIMISQRMPDYMTDIMNRVNQFLFSCNFDINFNAILLNMYEHGKEYISAHSDSEIGLKNNVVATISVGQNRIFRIRDKSTNNIVIDVPTYEKGLLLMMGNFQKYYTHEIPIEKYILDPRWSLTFREHHN